MAEQVKTKTAIKHYERVNPDITRQAVRIDDLSNEMASFKTSLIAKLASEKSDKDAKPSEK